MQSLDDKIKKMQEEAAQAQAKELDRLTVEHSRLCLIPEELRHLIDDHHRASVRDVQYNETIEFTFRPKTPAEALEIIDAWRNKYGVFLPMCHYSNSNGTVTAHPYGNFNESNKKREMRDGIALYSSAGKGFESFELYFSPDLQDGKKYVVSIRPYFMTEGNFSMFHARVTANYNRAGNVVSGSVRKLLPPAANGMGAQISIEFASGSPDAVNYYTIFNTPDFKTIVRTILKLEGRAAA